MKWHFGCSGRFFPGWHNTDREVDLTRLPLPFADASIDKAIGQHVIEHLSLEEELLPLFRELRRVVRIDGVFYLSCPDIAKICSAYCEGRLGELIDGRNRRFPGWYRFKGPQSQIVNSIFFQGGEHRNLFDYELLSWALREGGWQTVDRISERELLTREPEVLPRHDDEQSLYVAAR